MSLEYTYDLLATRLQDLINDSIREWISIQINRIYPIAGGISGAGVHYVSADLSFPGLANQKIPIDFVVKFSDRRTFGLEQSKYKELPSSLRQYFINFSAITKQISEEFCMVMEHLKGFETLEVLLYASPPQTNLSDIIGRISSILGLFRSTRRERTYRGQVNVGRLYLTDIVNSISEAAIAHGKATVDLYEKDLTINGEVCISLEKSFRTIREKSIAFESDDVTLMHGDCHARNIMINPRTLDLKFIDIDNLDMEGDPLYDLGELLADIEIFGYIFGKRRFVVDRSEKRYSYEINLPESVTRASDIFREGSGRLGEKNERRLKLSEARYLLNMVPRLSKFDPDKVTAVFLEAVRIMNEIARDLA